MAEAIKRTECVKVCFEPRLFIDLSHLADKDERKLADLCYIVLRRYAYGHANGSAPADIGTVRDHESP